jgi:hypothetical protein
MGRFIAGLLVVSCALVLGAYKLDEPARAFRRDCEATGAHVVITAAGPRCAKLDLVSPPRNWSN